MKNITNDHINKNSNPAINTAMQVVASDKGQGISEYLIILAVVVIAAIALATTFSTELTGLWDSITSQLSAIA